MSFPRALPSRELRVRSIMPGVIPDGMVKFNKDHTAVGKWGIGYSWHAVTSQILRHSLVDWDKVE